MFLLTEHFRTTIREGNNMKDRDDELFRDEGQADFPIQLLSSPGAFYDRTKRMMRSAVRYKEMRMMYACALKEIRTKFDVLNTEFNVRNKRNPIASVSMRLKSTESTARKLIARGYPLTFESVEKNITDIAGIRVICSYIDDIYTIADALLKQDDIRLIARKDYIKNPKPNGYRSLHLIVSIPVFFAEQKKDVTVEVQIRTIAMDFWASLEHQIKYKKDIPGQEEVVGRLKDCADVIARTDEQMLELRKKIETAEDLPSEEEELLDKLKKFDMPIV